VRGRRRRSSADRVQPAIRVVFTSNGYARTGQRNQAGGLEEAVQEGVDVVEVMEAGGGEEEGLAGGVAVAVRRRPGC